MSRVGGQLAVGQRREPERLGVFFIDSSGTLRERRWDASRRTGDDEGPWDRIALPRADGLPFGTPDHPPGSLAAGYQRSVDRLDLFAVDRDGLLRVFTVLGDEPWTSDVVPEATVLPPGACLATGFERLGGGYAGEPGANGGLLLDVFTTGRAGQPLFFQAGPTGKWRANQLPYDAPLPYGANLVTGYRDGRRLLTVFTVDRDGALLCFALSPDSQWQVSTTAPGSASTYGSAAVSGLTGGGPAGWIGPSEAGADSVGLPPGAPLAVGYPDGGEPSVYAVDRAGRLREFRQDRDGRWPDRPLPVDGMPPLAAVAAGYHDRPQQEVGRQLLVFVVDEAGRLRQYAYSSDGSYSVGVVPGGLGLPAGAPLAVGYREGGAVMDVFVLDSYATPPLRFSARAGGWTGPHPI